MGEVCGAGVCTAARVDAGHDGGGHEDAAFDADVAESSTYADVDEGLDAVVDAMRDAGSDVSPVSSADAWSADISDSGSFDAVRDAGLDAQIQDARDGGSSGVDAACVAESDAAFCSRLSKACGRVTAADNCGVERTVQSCGSCPGFSWCGGAGTANQCGGRQEPSTPVCGINGWCWENPLPVGSNLYDAATSPQGTDWVVGAKGTVLSFDGSTWAGAFGIGGDEALTGVWAFSDTDVWAAGHGGVIVHFNGQQWTRVVSGTTNDFYDVYGSADGTLWIIGESGTILRRPSGGPFGVVSIPGVTDGLRAIDGAGQSVWISGYSFILYYNGASWSRANDFGDWTDVKARSPTDAWVVSYSKVKRFSGGQWLDSSASILSGQTLALVGSNEVHVIGRSGGMYVFDGLSWSVERALEEGALNTTETFVVNNSTKSPRGTLLVGDTGALLRHVAGRWERVNVGWLRFRGNRRLGIKDAVLAGTEPAVAVMADRTSQGFLLRRTGNVWRDEPTPFPFYALGASSPSNIIGVGSRAARYDGTRWTEFGFPPIVNQLMKSVAVLSSTDAWAVGDYFALHFDGRAWTAVPNPYSAIPTADLSSVSFASPTQGWAGGYNTPMMFYDGNVWSTPPGAPISVFPVVRMLRPNVAFAAFGGVKAWDGVTWSPTIEGTIVVDLAPVGTASFYSFRAAGSVFFINGSTMTDVGPGYVPNAHRLVVSGTSLWAIGDEMEILYKP